MKRIAVVLLNLGGPDSRESIKPFLYNFFMDKNIIRVPLPLRWLIAKLISVSRSKGEAGGNYAELGYKSPILDNTQEQAKMLQKKLGNNYKVFVCMRYWHPMTEEVVNAVKQYGPSHVVLLPLYPQFSTTTTRSSFQTWNREARKEKLNVPTSKICCYPVNTGFIRASAENISRAYEDALKESLDKELSLPRVLFSAHGLPENVIRNGDPYQWQCEQTARKIVKCMKVENLDWQICYQSRIGPKKWVGPSTQEALYKAARDNVPVIIYPHAFVNEHVETLVEIEIEYRELARKTGIPYFARVPTVGASPTYIEGLAEMVKSFEGKQTTETCSGRRLCPVELKECGMNKFSEHGKAA